MIKTIISDLSRVILFPKDTKFTGELNSLYREKSTLKDFAFHDEFVFNDVLLKYFDQVKNDYQLIIFTTGTIQNVPVVKKRLETIFQEVFSVIDIGHNKATATAYEYILKHIDKQPEETIFIDDTVQNIAAAKQAGIHTVHFTTNEEVLRKLSVLLRDN